MTYSKPARTAARSARLAILAVVMAVSAALIGVLIFKSAAPSQAESSKIARLSAPAVPPLDTSQSIGRGERGTDRPPRHEEKAFEDQSPAVAKLDPDLREALKNAATDAAEDGVAFVINSGWRSRKYQKRLLKEAVSKYGSEREAARWVATADTSPHVSGGAIDVGRADAMAWLSGNGAKYGLCQIYKNEPWHFELRPRAASRGCPPMYADPTQDPRMQE